MNTLTTKLFSASIALAVLILIFQLAQFTVLNQSSTSPDQVVKLKTKTGEVTMNIEEITREILPEKKVLPVTWMGLPHKLVALGIIDIEKLKEYSRRYGQQVTDEDLKIFQKDFNGNIEITPQNSVLIYNVLWAIGFATKSPVLDYELAKYGRDTVKNLAGYYFSFANLGNRSTFPHAGYNYFELIPLTPTQKDLVMNIAGKSAVPSCGNALHLPDCSCSFAIVALIEMMASQGFQARQIYQTMKDAYPYRFPGIYVQQAIFFRLSQNQKWNEVNAEELVSTEFSSAQGVARMMNSLANILNSAGVQSP